MRNIRVLGLAFLAIFAFGAIVAASAQAGAPAWTVTEPTGTAKTLGVTDLRTLTGETTGIPKLVGAGITLTSSGCHTHGTIRGNQAVTGPGTFTGTLHCTDVTVEGAAACRVHSPGAPDGTVITSNILGVLVWLQQAPSHKTGMLFSTYTEDFDANNDPIYTTTTEGTFVTLEITGCALAGNYPVTGEQICEVSPFGEHKIEGTLNCPTPRITKYFTNQTPGTRVEDSITPLKLKGAAATFTSHAENLHLTGNVEWGIETN